MAIDNAVSAIPEGYHTVTTFVVVADSIQFTSFMKEAFSAVELGSPVMNADGSVGHAEVKIGDSVVMMFDAKSTWPHTPAFLRLYVEDCRAVYDQALKAGASSVTKPTHLAWGDMVARVRDPFNNIWWIQARIEKVDAAEMTERATDEKFTAAMEYVQSADFFPSHSKSP